jgi:CBS domain-containing protein
MLRELKVKDALSKRVFVVDENSSVKDAARIMLEKKCRELIVISNEEVIGIIVDADITRRVVAKGLDPEKTKVREVMTKNLFTAKKEDSLEEIARMMVRRNISRVPVVSNDRLIGLITYIDILKVFPAYIELLKEESHYEEETKSVLKKRGAQGMCDSCGNYSEGLTEIDSEFLCEECVENRIG